MNSTTKVNYETRPYKFAERSMLLSAFQRICNKFPGTYQYVGFGGLTFTDFKLFHRGLHITDMHSIEGGSLSKKRLDFNKPYAYIQVHKSFSTESLRTLDLSKKTIVWLDYDGSFDTHIFDDMIISLNALPIGSIYLMTCNKNLCLDDGVKNPSIDEFKEHFGQYATIDVKQIDLSTASISKLFRKMLMKCAIETFTDRNKRDDADLKFVQLFDICYADGAPMYTFGGIILNHDYEVDNLDITDLPFVFSEKNTEPYIIKMPNITFKESLLLNRHLDYNNGDYPEDLKEIIDPNQLKSYREVYKYLPNFVDVHI